MVPYHARRSRIEHHDRTAPDQWPAALSGLIGKLVAAAVAIVAVAVLIIVLSAVSLLPRLHNPFGETTSVRSGRCCSSRSRP